jgi:ATP-dependent Clp protease ATP-binding subunit ClpC
LNKLKVDYDNVKEQFKFMITSDDDYLDSPKAESFSDDEDANEEDDSKQIPFGQSTSKTAKKSKTPVLDNFGRDLTALAEEDKLDPVVGREKEIQRVSQILSRRKKNNPLLIV